MSGMSLRQTPFTGTAPVVKGIFLFLSGRRGLAESSLLSGRSGLSIQEFTHPAPIRNYDG